MRLLDSVYRDLQNAKIPIYLYYKDKGTVERRLSELIGTGVENSDNRI